MWNSLEIFKLTISAATPLAVVFVAALLARQNSRIADRRNDAVADQAMLIARYSKVVDKRVLLWDTLGPELNAIYSHNLEVGNWAQMTAADVVRSKRNADRVFYAYRPFFTAGFAAAYDRFMAAGFQTYNGVGEDAKLRTSNENHGDAETARFTGENNQRAVYDAYFNQLKYVGDELDTTIKEPPFRASIPGKAG